jgi:hypothetical protein
MAFLTMEVSGPHARTRAITGDTVSPANRSGLDAEDASRDVARVVSDVSVLCPRLTVCSYNREHHVWMRLMTTMTSCRLITLDRRLRGWDNSLTSV